VIVWKNASPHANWSAAGAVGLSPRMFCPFRVAVQHAGIKVFVMYVRTTDHVFKAQSRKIDDPAAFGNGLLRRAYSVLVSLPSGYASTRRGLPRLGFGPCGRM